MNLDRSLVLPDRTPDLPPTVAVVSRCDLTMRGADRIESLPTRFEKRVEVKFHTWQYCRDMRRDFNLLSEILHRKWRHPEHRPAIATLLKDLEDEVDALTNSARKYPLPPDTGKEVVLALRLISPQAESLCEMLAGADRALFKLLHSEIGPTAQEECNAVNHKYKRLKKYLLARRSPEKKLPENHSHDDSH